MTYIQGFLVAVPAGNKQAYIEHATSALPMFKEFGAERMVEGWGDDVPDGKVTDFKRAVEAKPEEAALFSWIEFPDRATCDAASERIMTDPRLAEMGEMPFDATRMVFGGFESFVEAGPGGATGYVDGYLLPVLPDRKDGYVAMARMASQVFLDHGAIRVVEAWGDNIPDGKVTDFRRAVKAEPGEGIVLSWVEWPSKAARDAGGAKVMADDRMKTPPEAMPFDGTRMIYGGFAPILDA